MTPTSISSRQDRRFGNGQDERTLGGKGANLDEMCRSAAVPEGFTITTEVCQYYDRARQELSPELKQQVEDWMKKTSKRWAPVCDSQEPLHVSDRSGARVSQPALRYRPQMASTKRRCAA